MQISGTCIISSSRIRKRRLKDNLAEGECVGKCDMPNDNEDRTGSDRLMHDGIY